MLPIPESDRIYGTGALAEFLGTSKNAIHSARSRGRFGLEPVANLGRMLIFSRQQAAAYRAEKQRRKAS